MNSKFIDLPSLESLQFNGVIHIGAGLGEYVKNYYDLGIHQVVWVERDESLYKELYANTCKFGMKQLYLFQFVSGKNDFKEMTLKNLWRKNSCDIDIETYDLLVLDIKENLGEIFDGLENFKDNFKHVITTHVDLQFHEYMDFNGYKLDVYSDNYVLYTRKDI